MATRSQSSVRLLDAIARYEERITVEGQSPASIYTAHYALERFRKFIATPRNPNPFLHTITPADADTYCYGAEGIRRGVAAVTFNRYRSVLKVFFDYAIMVRWVDTNPFDGIGAARADTPKSRLMLSATELLTMLEHTTSPVERIALSLGMNTGLRANDLRHLTIFDASLQTGTIQTEIRKTNKLDIKPITLELHRELVTWLDTYAELTGLSSRSELPNEWILIPSMQLNPVRAAGRYILKPTVVRTNMHRLVQRPLAKMGYPTKGEGFHTLRRSSARALFESLRSANHGRDHALMICKEFLNHATTGQTEHYLGLNQERIIRDSLLKDQPFLSSLSTQEQERAASTATTEPVRRLNSA